MRSWGGAPKYQECHLWMVLKLAPFANSNWSIEGSGGLLSVCLLTANHHDDDAIDLFVGRVGRDVAKPHRGEGGEREIQ